ncbi:uncharacterized protein LOC116343557 [Contarinia nasturtii]|uniref:uncharacterized protein LOC116343557 n=1 Tax=Contarinia nasturtii TaxID=265458 RepID=UPI0012D473DE|nr:uncharacterized protein LOC116343557 [Contarinia nasturtii]
MIKIVLFVWSVGFCVCDQPSWNVGYRYSVPLGEYGAPPLPTPSVQVSKENVQFVEQTVEINTPSNRYQPSQSSQFKPSNSPSVAFLPKPDPPKPFRSSIQTNAKFSKPRQSGLIQQQRAPLVAQLSKQILSTEYGAPPANSYPYPPSISAPSPPVHEVVDDTPLLIEDDEENDTTDPTVIAVANASGRYYILGKDNTLQRVVYKTTRTEDDNVHNGFTAHLEYSPVEPIRDPVYGYDEQGHLVRIYNKK